MAFCRLMSTLRIVVLAAAGLFAGSQGAHAQQGDKPYRIIDGKVDQSTFLGWRAFHSACHTCHGVDATGTDIAPNLVERIRDLSAQDFATKVITSYRLAIPSSEAAGDNQTALRKEILDEVVRRESGELVMPAWEGDPKVRPRVMDLYTYLRARADGALGPGQPPRLQE